MNEESSTVTYNYVIGEHLYVWGYPGFRYAGDDERNGRIKVLDEEDTAVWVFPSSVSRYPN